MTLKNHFTIWLLAAILLNQTINVNLAAIEETTTEEHISHDHDQEEHHSSEWTEVTLKNHGEDCLAEGVKCNDKEGLVCFEDVGKCDCNKHIGLVYSPEHEKCEELPDPVNSPVLHENILDDGEVDSDDDDEVEEDPTTTTGPELEKGSGEAKEDRVNHIHKEEEHHTNHNDSILAQHCENDHCSKALGEYSLCDEATGDCSCYDSEGQNRAVELKDGKCWIVKKINDPCTSHAECASTIKGKAWCHMDLTTLNRFCQCEVFHYFDEDLQECLPFATDGVKSECKTDKQCTGIERGMSGHGLGPNAKCSEAGFCECILDANGEKTFLTENYCFIRLQFGDICNFDRECQVSLLGYDAICSEESKTCVCRHGEPCFKENEAMNLDSRRSDDEDSDNGFLSDEADANDGVISSLKSAMGLQIPNFVFILVIGGIVLLVIVVIAVVVIRRRHRYSAVRTNDPLDSRHS